ncbi:MAG TPA: Fe-Mn family superoxide dismutase [Candidatus Paceibacterota bacterium]
MTYTEQSFDLPVLQDISPKQTDVHLKLYQGYVKFFNHLREIETELMKDAEKNAYALSEVHRRLSFEFDGMRMHELYFAQWEKGPETLTAGGSLEQTLMKQFGSITAWENIFKSVGLMRGIGWTVLYYDDKVGEFLNVWVGDHEVGQLAGVPIILAMDMWEHAYMVDYTPAEKKNYIEAFFKNLNWSVPQTRFGALSQIDPSIRL